MVGSGAQFLSGLALRMCGYLKKRSAANELPSSPVVNCLFLS